MIAFIQGKIAAVTLDSIILDHQGMGWLIRYPHVGRVHIREEHKIYTYMHIAENDISMFGFESQLEKDLFLRLISVKGLGPKTAAAMLSKADAEQIISAVEGGNVAFLKSMPGVGNKSASQIILDLKGKLVQSEEAAEASMSSEVRDACDALAGLGYKQSEIRQAAKVMNEQPGRTSSEYLKIGLKVLAQNKIGG